MRAPKKYLLLLLPGSAAALADPIAIPNFSFESPPVVRDKQNPFGALPFIDDWDETAVGEADEFDQNTGNFINTDPGQPDHITNLEGDRAAFLSSLIGNAIRQELPETYIPGASYSFTVSVGTSSFFSVGLGEQLEVALFYFDDGAEQIVALSLVSGIEVGTTTLLDVTVTSEIVEEGDPWAGQPIGVLVRPSIADPSELDGEGFWNVDYARLDELLPPNADGDGDGDVDLRDFAMLQNCFSGIDELAGGCSTFDLNPDSAVNLDDYWLFFADLTEPVGE